MQPSAQFKLEQSLSTDGISNQSTTQARGAHAALMNLEGRKKRYPKKKRQQKWSPPAVTHFTTGSSVCLHFLKTTLQYQDKDHKTWYSYSRSSESSVALNSKTGRKLFSERSFFWLLLWGFSNILFRAKRKLTKRQQLNAEMWGRGSFFNKLWHHILITATWG